MLRKEKAFLQLQEMLYNVRELDLFVRSELSL